MLEALATLLGAFAGIGLCWVPGLHAALGLTFLVAFGLPALIGGPAAAMFLAAACGAIVYAKRLGIVYHPVAGSGNEASMDVAHRLTARGRGPEALRLMVYGIDQAWVGVAALALFLMVTGIAGFKVVPFIAHWTPKISSLVIVIWLVYTCRRSSKPAVTLAGIGLCGLVGYGILHHPALAGNEHVMAPLMGGLFGVPMMLAVLHEHSAGMPAQLPPGHLHVNTQLGLLGSAIGVASGFLAGIGANSLVGFCQDATSGDEEYLLLAASGEAAKEIGALLVMLVAGIGHTGEAQLLGRVAGQPNPVSIVLLLVAIAFGAWCGRKAVFKFESTYTRFITWKPPGFWAVIVIGLACLQVVLTGQWLVGFSLMFGATCIALWCREQKLPFQVGFGCLAIPLLVTQVPGAVLAVNGILFS